MLGPGDKLGDVWDTMVHHDDTITFLGGGNRWRETQQH